MALTQTQRKALEKLREKVQFKDCQFMFSPEAVTAIATQKRNGPWGDDTEAVKDVTRTYIETYVIPFIDALLAEDTARLKDLLKHF